MQLPMQGGIFGALDPVQEAIRRARYGQQPVFGSPSEQPAQDIQGGILGKLDQKLQPFGGLLGVGANLLAESGRNGSFGGSIGNALLAGRQTAADNEQNKLRGDYMKAQIEAMQRPKQADTPNAVQEYEYAKQNGYTGTFSDWKTMGSGQAAAAPASLQEWEAFQRMNPEQQKQYLNMKRQPSQPQIVNVGGVPTIVDRLTAGQTPLSTLDAENQAAAARAQASATGTVSGEIQGQAQKRAVGAGRTLSTIEQAEKLINNATGSIAGAGIDAVAGAFGGAPQGAQAIAGLKVLQANLMTEMPRMEGPQSDRDVQLYREAAGQIGDPTVPRPIKRAALSTIKELQKRYQAGGGPAAGGPIQPGQSTTINGVKVKRTK